MSTTEIPLPILIPAIDPGIPVFNAREACEQLGGIALRTLGNYTRKGKLVSRRVGGKVFFHPSDLTTFTQTTEQKPDLRKGKTSEEALRKLRALGFKV